MNSFIYIVRNTQTSTQTDKHAQTHTHTQGTTVTEESMNLKKILWEDFREDKKGRERVN